MSMDSLLISGPNENRSVRLDPEGMTIGRGFDCHIVLNDKHLSWIHARIYQDPFQRWVIEDLGSHNGVFVEDMRIQARALLPGEKIRVAAFTLTLVSEPDQQLESSLSGKELITTAETGLVQDTVLSTISADRPLIKQLNEITKQLLKLSCPGKLYPQACHHLSAMFDSPVTVVRIPADSKPLPTNPEVLACSLNRQDTKETKQTPVNMYLSQKVLNAIRAGGDAVMGKSTPTPGEFIPLTVVDEHHPHQVYAASVTDPSETIDILYLEILEAKVPPYMLEFIEAMARQINFARESLLLSEARTERKLIDQQLSLAREIQSQLTPRGLEKISGIEVAVLYEPALWVGGDLCDVWTNNDGKIVLALGDVVGKGLAAAMIMSTLHAALRTTMTFYSELDIVLHHINRYLAQNLFKGRFVTLFLGIYDLSTSRLTYVNAGHLLPFKIRSGSAGMTLGKPSNPPLGILDDTLFKVETETISRNEGILIFTDGVTEARSPIGEEFGEERLKKLANTLSISLAQEYLQSILTEVDNFRDKQPQQDDTTMLLLFNHQEVSI